MLLPYWIPYIHSHICFSYIYFRCDRNKKYTDASICVVCSFSVVIDAERGSSVSGRAPHLWHITASLKYWVHPKKRLLRVLNTIWSLSSDATFWRRVTWKKMFRQQQQSLHLPHQRQKEDKSSKHKLQGKEAKVWHSVFVQVHNQYWTNQNKVLFSPHDQSILSFTINGISRITIPPYCLAWRYANMYFSDVVTQNWQGAPSIS